jgi:hypothetical protein
MAHDHHSHSHVVPHEEPHADAWHHHTASEHPQFEHGSTIHYRSILFWSAALVIATVGSIGAVWIYFDHYVEKVKAERFEYNLYRFEQTEADAFKLMQDRPSRVYKTGVDDSLNATGWIDPQKEVIQIPISLAKEKVLKKYSQSK